MAECKKCGGSQMIRTDEPSGYYWFCGCRYHTWCPDCTWAIRRWLERLMLRLRPIQ